MKPQASAPFVVPEETFRRMIEATPDPVSLNDLESGIYIEVNQAWCRFTGIARDQAIGRTAAGLGLWADRHELRAFVRAMRNAETLRNFDARFRVANGKVRFGSVSGTTFDLNGRLAVITWTRDVTEPKQVEQMRRELIRMLTHDIKNPLGVIMGFANLLRDEVRAPSPGAEMIDSIESAAHQAMALALNFLEADRIESGALELHRAPASVNEIVDHTVRHQSARARQQKVELRTRLDAGLPSIALDQPLIDRVLANLLNNAIKFSPSPGPVDIVTKQRDDCLVIEIWDRGPGIADEEVTEIFRRYGRRIGARTDSTGLGLFIVKTIVEAHGGTVEVRARPEGGSVFAVSFPLEPNI